MKQLSGIIRHWLKRKALALSVLLGLATGALAHSWYPWYCCHDQDCHPVTTGELWRDSGGWRTSTQFIPDGDPRIQQYPEDAPPEAHVSSHICRDPATGKVLCIYLGDGGI